jgi:hypothetical protein
VVQSNRPLASPVIQANAQAPRQADDELVQIKVRMSPPVLTGGDVIHVKNSPYYKWYVSSAFEKGQVATMVVDLWEVHEFTVINIHRFPPSTSRFPLNESNFAKATPTLVLAQKISHRKESVQSPLVIVLQILMGKIFITSARGISFEQNNKKYWITQPGQ